MKYRHPDGIVPINSQEELLLAIYDEVAAIRKALAQPSPFEGLVEVPAAAVEKSPEPAAAAAPRKAAKRKTTARKKKAT